MEPPGGAVKKTPERKLRKLLFRIQKQFKQTVSRKNFLYYFSRFLGSDDPNAFFSRAQRSRMLWEILATAPFGKEKKGEVGVERLVNDGAYSAAFPLHDVTLPYNFAN